jgi:carboxyl-terminal processing protease
MKKFFYSHQKSVSYAAILLAVIFLFVMGFYLNEQVSAVESATYKNLKLFNEALDIIDKNYVEKVDSKTLIQGGINGMVKSLDPHSTFLTADMHKELQTETRGSFGGIGIEITIVNDILTVVSPIEDTPAFLAGIKAGDQIVKIDDKPTKGISILEAVKKLRGPENTTVKLSIMRKDHVKPNDYTIRRAIINVKSVKFNIYENNIAYIRISSFQEKTVEELSKAIKDIEKKSGRLSGLILDLRNDPGGLLDQAVKVSDAFLKTGTIVTIKGRGKNIDNKFSAKDNGNEPTCPIVVLVNEGTASASEIVAGALQDNGRAVILGTQTFGKGSVQTVIPFEDGSALKLTTAKYYTPKGRSIQAEGIAPDIYLDFVKPPEEKNHELTVREKDLKGHIVGDDEKIEKTGAPKTPDDLLKDNQLKAAIDLIKSWKIFEKINNKS